MKLTSSVALALLTTSILLPACNSKIDECNKVAAVANKAVGEMHKMEAQMHDEAHDAAALARDAKKFAELIEATSKEISAISINTEGLKPLIAAYTGMLDAAAVATRDMLGVLEGAGDITDDKVKATEQRLEGAQGGLSSACEAESEDCTKIMAIMAKLSDPPPDQDIGKALKAHADELSALELSNDTVKAANTAYVAVINDFVTMMSVIEKLDASMVKLDEAVGKEDEIVNNINSFCSAP